MAQRKERTMEGSLKELPFSFDGRGEVKGFTFIQVKRSKLAYIYKVLDTFGNQWYEVFKRRENARFGQIAYLWNMGLECQDNRKSKRTI